jgi:hypothetical protein
VTLNYMNQLYRHTKFSRQNPADCTMLNTVGLPPTDIMKKSPSLNKPYINSIPFQFIDVS